MAKRRARNEGSVFKRTRAGKTLWVAELTVGFDAQGRREVRTKYAATQKKALEKLEELRGKVRAGVDLVNGAGRQRLGEYLDEWLQAKENAGLLRPSTVANYSTLISLHVKRHLIAARRLESLRPADVKRWHAELRRREVGARTRQAAHTLLRSAIGDAVRENLLLYNPADRVPRPRATQTERVVLNRKHVTALLKAAKASPYEAAFLLAVLHGLRVGELLGLTYGDIDLREGVVTISRQLVEERRTGKRELAEVKTAAGRRTVPLSSLALAALQRLHDELGATPLPGNLLFSDANGQPLRRSNFHRRVWVPIRDKAKLPKGTRFHDLRHAAASALLGAGMDVATVAGTLGHASPNVTLRVYAHALPDRMREAAQQIDAIYAAR
jgi:integrase